MEIADDEKRIKFDGIMANVDMLIIEEKKV